MPQSLSEKRAIFLSRIAPTTSEFAESFGLPIRKGALITGVLQDGAASKAGVRPGDVVVDVEGSEVGSTGQLLDVVAALKPGASAKVRVQRGERTLELTALVAQRPRPDQRP